MSTEFVSWYNGKKSDFHQFLNALDLVKLNLIAPTYHSAFGYNLSEQMWEDMDLFESSIKNAEVGLVEVEGGDDELWILNVKEAEKIATTSKLSHKTIIIRLRPKGESGWTKTPSKVTSTRLSGKQKVKKAVYWYNFPFKHNPELRGDAEFVEPLNTREYIHVTDPFDEVEIRSEEKGRRITMDDILFATRGLCADDTRSTQQYHVLSDDGSTLMLMADIDNWST